jgi:ubiquitin-activating enzyme E1
MKLVSSKATRLTQFLYLYFVDSLAPETLPTAEEAQLLGCRYDSQTVIFGRAFQEKLQNLKYFLVGSAAIGWETAKNYAMMGVACGRAG